MRRMVWAVLLSGLFLLMLSALVVTPDTAVPTPQAPVAGDWQAVFHPLVSAILPDAAAEPRIAERTRMILSPLPLFWHFSAPPAAVSDANGRILTALRYENSVYQLFRPEVAGG